MHDSHLQEGIQQQQERGILQQLKEVIRSMRRVIEGQTRVNAEVFNLYLSLNMNFSKSRGPGVKTDPTVTFRSEVFKSINIYNFDYQFHEGRNQTVLQIDEFQRNGSGWVIDHPQHLDPGTWFL